MGETWSYDFFLANTGLGKSLSPPIGHAILENRPEIRAYYITAEDFVNDGLCLKIIELKSSKQVPSIM
jgi:chromosomal replication initiation ATPase DnaA